MNRIPSLILLATIFLTACSQQVDTPVQQATNQTRASDDFIQSVQDSYDLAEKWLVDNQKENGLFAYIYHPKTDTYPSKNNAIRQLMGSRLLAEITHEKPELLNQHRHNLRFLFSYWYKEDGDIGYIEYSDKSKLGANAMMLRTLVWSPDFHLYRDQARKLANGILSLMGEDGGFHPWYKEPDYHYDKDYLLTFYSGEALVALAEYYEKSGDMDILTAAVESQNFYIDRYVTHMDRHYYPAYVPWHTISLNKLFKLTGEDSFAEAAFALNDKLLEMLDRTDEVGRFYNPETPQYGTPHSSSDGVYTEGMVYAYELALLMNDQEHIQRYDEALRIAVPNLIKLQYTAEEAAVYDHPERIIGALRINKDRTGIRTDTTQHTMDAYRKILEVYPKD